MKKGFTAKEKKQVKEYIGQIDTMFENLIEFLKTKHELAEEWAEERTDAWHESENGESFEEWVNELDFKIDELENQKEDYNIESFDEVL